MLIFPILLTFMLKACCKNLEGLKIITNRQLHLKPDEIQFFWRKKKKKKTSVLLWRFLFGLDILNLLCLAVARIFGFSINQSYIVVGILLLPFYSIWSKESFVVFVSTVLSEKRKSLPKTRVSPLHVKSPTVIQLNHFCNPLLRASLRTRQLWSFLLLLNGSANRNALFYQ